MSETCDLLATIVPTLVRVGAMVRALELFILIQSIRCLPLQILLCFINGLVAWSVVSPHSLLTLPLTSDRLVRTIIVKELEELAEVSLHASSLQHFKGLDGLVNFILAHEESLEDTLEVLLRVLTIIHKRLETELG